MAIWQNGASGGIWNSFGLEFGGASERWGSSLRINGAPVGVETRGRSIETNTLLLIVVAVVYTNKQCRNATEKKNTNDSKNNINKMRWLPPSCSSSSESAFGARDEPRFQRKLRNGLFERERGRPIFSEPPSEPLPPCGCAGVDGDVGDVRAAAAERRLPSAARHASG